MNLQFFVVTLPYPPSANRMWRHVDAKVLRSREYETWRQHCTLLIRQETRRHGLVGPYAMTMQVGRPDRRRRDLDNLIKPVGDVLVLAGAVADDSDCQKIEAAWTPEIVGVRVMVMETKLIPPSQAAGAVGMRRRRRRR